MKKFSEAVVAMLAVGLAGIGIRGCVALVETTQLVNYRFRILSTQPDTYTKLDMLDYRTDKEACPLRNDIKVSFEGMLMSGERVCRHACCNDTFNTCIVQPNEICSW